MKLNPLIGKTITAIQLTTDKKAIRFVLGDGTDVVANADGDCCSSTWIEHILMPASGFPAVVLEAHDIEMPDLGTPPNAECIAYYGFEIKTDKGDMTIDYRNESNGYYGGNLSWPGEDFYGGVFSQNVANDEWRDVKQDM
jgi:hypothetical protein